MWEAGKNLTPGWVGQRITIHGLVPHLLPWRPAGLLPSTQIFKRPHPTATELISVGGARPTLF